MRAERKDKGVSSASGAQSWRELAGPQRRRRVVSAESRRRRRARWIKLSAGAAVLVALLVGVVWAVLSFERSDAEIQLTPPSRPIERIVFRTNGVLPDRWLSSVIDLKPGMTMMEADIHRLKEKLEAEGQVKSASVERRFPSDLVVEVVEHVPVLRLATVGSDGRRRTRIVARDGTVYEGTGYGRSTLLGLPYLDPYRPAEGSPFPLRGIERVAVLLETARAERPELYRSWQIVSLKHYSGDLDLPGQVIEVQSSIVPRIIFSASGDFAQQLDRLDYILNYVRNRGNPSLERVDLSLRGSAAVQFTSGRIGTF